MSTEKPAGQKAGKPPHPSRYELNLESLTGPLAIQRGRPAGAREELFFDELKVYAIPIQHVLLWPDNHNEMDEATFQGELESMLIHDFVDPVFVRPFTEEDLAAGLVNPQDLADGVRPQECVEMIDGEHRLRGVASFCINGFPPGSEAPTVLSHLVQRQAIAAHIIHCSRPWAERMRLAFSELHGKKNYRKLGRLVSAIAKNVSPEELRIGTPWSVDAVKELLAVGTFDWDKFNADKAAEAGDKQNLDDPFLRGTIECPAAHRGSFLDAFAKLQAQYGVRFKETRKGTRKKG